MRAAAAWATAAILVAGAWTLTLLAPADDAGDEAFVTTMTIGQPAAGRNIAATVSTVRATDTITAADGWTADGTWVVVDLSAEAMSSQSAGYLRGATLTIGDRTFSATERGPDEMTLLGSQLVPGVPLSGSLMFEVPDDALDGTARLRLATSTSPWGDTILEMTIDLEALERVDEILVADVEWTNP